jgi:hypothetical protein
VKLNTLAFERFCRYRYKAAFGILRSQLLFRVLKYLLSMPRSAQNSIAVFPETACSASMARHRACVSMTIIISPMKNDQVSSFQSVVKCGVD